MPTSTPTDPFVSHIYTADPSAHSFNGRIYVYPSHDRESNIGFNDRGDQYDMVDYHVLSMDKVDGGGETTDHGVALKVEDVIWASKQLWAPDAFKGRDGRYWLCFPARDQEGESSHVVRSSKGDQHTGYLFKVVWMCMGEERNDELS